MRTPWVSVLIPCRDQGRFLNEALASVFAQEGAAMEAIVVNDGSRDETASIIERWCRRLPGRVKGIEGGGEGQALARRRAAREARGEYWITLDADDGLLPNMVAQGLEALARAPMAVAAVGDVLMTDADGRRVSEILRQRGLGDWPAVLESCPIGAWNGVLLRAEMVRAVGGIGVDGPPGAEDWDLAVRLVRAGMSVVPIRRAVAWYRQHPGSHSRTPLPPLLARLAMLERCRAPDSRLEGIGREQPILTDKAYQVLRNRMIFFALGVAAVVKAEEAMTVLSFLIAGPRQEACWAAAYAEGFAHALRGGFDRPGVVPPEVREAVVAVFRQRWGWEVKETGAFILRMARAVRWRLFPGPRHFWRRLQVGCATRLLERSRAEIQRKRMNREVAS